MHGVDVAFTTSSKTSDLCGSAVTTFTLQPHELYSLYNPNVSSLLESRLEVLLHHWSDWCEVLTTY